MIIFCIYLFHFGIIVFVFYPVAVVRIGVPEKGFPKNFAKFTRQHLFQGLFFKRR